MFASRVTKEIQLPSDPSVTVTIKKLSWLQRKSAQQIAQRESARGLVEMGGATFMKEWKALQEDDSKKEQVEAELTDPLTTHDLKTVLVCGVKAWTVDVPVTPDAVADLEDAEFVAREILALSLPTAEQEKNG